MTKKKIIKLIKSRIKEWEAEIDESMDDLKNQDGLRNKVINTGIAINNYTEKKSELEWLLDKIE